MGERFLSKTGSCGAFQSLREFVDELEKKGLLVSVSSSVDKDWEVACISRLCQDSLASQQPMAVRFANVAGHSMPVVTGLYGTRENYARALSCLPNEILGRWNKAMEYPLPAIIEKDGAFKENTVTGADVDLFKLPIPVWTPQKDAGPYLSSACVITKDAENQVQNIGTYRIQLQGKSSLSVGFGSENQHGAIHMRKFHDQGKPCPVALVIGAPPAVQFAAAAKTAYGVDEVEIAGGLAGEPVTVVQGQTTDLSIPCQSEIVIEGFIHPGANCVEGPFGEALGIMSETGSAPLMQVTSLCRRTNSLMHGLVQQIAPSEGHFIWELGILGPLFYYLHTRLGFSFLRDLCIAPGSAGLNYLAVQISESTAEDKKRLLSILAKIHFGQKFVCLVDSDIDIHDPLSLQFAQSSRVNPEHDITIIPDVPVYQADYSIYAGLPPGSAAKAPFSSALMLIDATIKATSPSISLPPADLMEKIRSRWSELGLPNLRQKDRISMLLSLFLFFIVGTTCASFADDTPSDTVQDGTTATGVQAEKKVDDLDRSNFIKGGVRAAALRTMDGLIAIESSAKILQSSAMELMKEVTRKETVVVRGPNFIGNGIVIPAIGDPSGTMQMGNLPARRKKVETFLSSSEQAYAAVQSQVDALIIPDDAPDDLHNLWLGMRSIMSATKENIEKLRSLANEPKLAGKSIGRASLKVYDSMTALDKIREQMLNIVKTKELNEK